MYRSAQHPHKPPATFCRHCGTLHKRNEKIQIMEKAAGSGQTGRIRRFSTRFGSADGAILRERGCFARERQVQGVEKCGTIKLQGGSVAMELRIAIVEDQKFEAQRLERLLRQAWGILSSATCRERRRIFAQSRRRAVCGGVSRYLHGGHERHRDSPETSVHRTWHIM